MRELRTPFDGLFIDGRRRGGGPEYVPLEMPHEFGVTLYRDADGYHVAETAADYLADYTGATVFVAPTGSDSTGTGAAGAPFATLDAAVAAAADWDRISLAPGVYPHPTAPITKSVAIVRTGGTGDVAFGDFYPGTAGAFTRYLTNYWQCTLANHGVLYRGMIRLDAAPANGVRATFQTNATYMQTLRGLNYLGMYTSASTCYFWLGDDAASAATLAADGKLLFWTDANAGGFVIGGGAQVYTGPNVILASAAVAMTVNAGATLVWDRTEIYGHGATIVLVNGTSLSFGGIVCGSGNNNIDYSANAIGVEIDVVSAGSKGNCSTTHSTADVLRVGGGYANAPRPLHDIGNSAANNWSFNLSIEINSGNYPATTMLQWNTASTGTTRGVWGDVTMAGTYTTAVSDNGGVNPAINIDLDDPWPWGAPST